MNKIAILVSTVLFPFLLQAQTQLTYANHALKAGSLHQMQKAAYVEPGKGGGDQVWDFSALVCMAPKETRIVDGSLTKRGNVFGAVNVAITDDGDKSYYYNLSADQSEYIGLVSENSYVEFTEPITKMKFPFAFGDSYSDDFKGTGYYNLSDDYVVESQVEGTYSAEADGYGVLKLPNGMVHRNVLRVKTVQHTTEVMACNATLTEVVKYMWYDGKSRYPLATNMVIRTAPSDKPTKITELMYYKDGFAMHKENQLAVGVLSFDVTPTLYSVQTIISYELAEPSKVSLTIFDTSLKPLKLLVANTEQGQGYHEYPFGAVTSGFVAGTYIVRLTVNDVVMSKKIVELDY